MEAPVANAAAAAAPLAPTPAPAPAAPMPPTPALAPAAAPNATAAETLSSIARPVQAAAQTTKNAITSASHRMLEFASANAKIVFGLLIVAGLGIFVGYFLYSFLRKRFTSRSAFLAKETQVPVSCLELTKANGSEIPETSNGRRLTMCFWIYIHDLNRNAGMYRHVFHRGDKSIQGASPLVFLDQNSNKLHIRFENENGSTASMNMNAPWGSTATIPGATSADKLAFDLATHGITIPYIPLQRWVHVAVVVNEDVNAGSFTYYIDSELVSVVQSGTPVEYATGDAKQTVVRSFQNLNLSRKGDLWIGGSPYEDTGPGFAGFVSRIQFFNYDLNASDVRGIYLAGPIDNLSSKLGLPAYGVRSPIYRIGQ